MQIAFARAFDKRASTLVLCFSGFATSPKFFAHLACDIPACNIAICYDYRDLAQVDSRLGLCNKSSLESTFLPPVLRDLQELIDRHRHCILVGFSLGVAVAARVIGTIDRAGAFRHSIAINGTPLGIDTRYGIHPRIYARTLEYFDVREFARAFFGSDDVAEITARAKAVKSPIMRGFNGDFSTLFGSVLECKQELQALQSFCQSHNQASPSAIDSHSARSVHFTHAIISSRDMIFSPMILESTFSHTHTQCHSIDAPHYVFESFTSWGKLLGICVPKVDSSSGARFWEARQSYTENAPIQATMRQNLMRFFTSWGKLLGICVPKVDSSSGARFWEARQSYTENAPIQATMRQNLMRLLLPHAKGREFEKVFEFGAGVGDFSVLLQENLAYTHFVCNDINNHASILQARLKPKTRVAIFDMHDIKNQPLCLERFDLIASNACLQWLNAKEILASVVPMLASGGLLLLGSFGARTCYEVREILGIGLEYMELEDLCELLQGLGLEIVESGSETLKLDCGSALGVFRHFRASGVNSLSGNALNKSKILAYQARFGGKITYEPVYILAQKPKP